MKFIAYHRVSTARQGASGLGLDAQRAAVLAHVAGAGGVLVASYAEVESGKIDARPELIAALAHCKALGACLCIAKLDRLSRSVAFVAGVMDSGVDFVACDFPQANRLTLHILAAVAEHERGMISARTKAALAVAKSRGKVLGNPNGARALRLAGRGNVAAVASLKAGADMRAKALLPIIDGIRGEGIGTLEGIAAAMNERGVLTPRGGRWNASTVRRMVLRGATE